MKLLKFALLLAASLSLAPMAARAQSTPGLVAKQVPSALQWNSYFGAKQDYSAQLSAFSALSGSGLLLETAGVPGLASLSAYLDSQVSSTTGTLLVRTSSGWGSLLSAAGCLQSTGTGVLPGYGSCSGTVGAGTVTSVTLAMPGSLFSVASPTITSSGTQTVSFTTQLANKVFAGPTTGSAATPTMRSLMGADLPNPSSSSLGGVQSLAPISNNFVTGVSTSGVPTTAQPACANLSDAGACAVAVGTSGNVLGKLNTANSYSATQSNPPVTLTDGATITPVLGSSSGNIFIVTLGGNRTLANPTGLAAGTCLVIFVQQDATGSRTLAYGSQWKWPSGTAPTLTTTANATDTVTACAKTTSFIAATFTADFR